jgi:serine/threonine-protein kinase
MQPDGRFIGRVLRERWRIERRIARGGMGTVFAASHVNNGSKAAIKVLHQELARDSDTRSRFLQEGYAANQVNHPGVVRILDDDVTEDGLVYLVMELLEGELLEQRRIRMGGRLPLVEVYDVADQLLDVLAAAHDRGIVHRDIKPDNLFLTHQGRLKVLDFGFAQMKSGARREQTATGFLLGTPGFMAPEQAMGNRKLIDAQTDIWAVGASLFLLITGQPCHEAESAAEMLFAAANVPVRSITTLDPHLPTKLAQAIDRALAFEKSKRWPDARAMQAALRAVPGRPPLREPPRRTLASIPPREEPTIVEHVEELGGVDDAERADGPTLAVRAPVDVTSSTTTAVMEGGPRPAIGALPAGPPPPFFAPQVWSPGIEQRASIPSPPVAMAREPAASAPARPPRRPVGFLVQVLRFVLVATITAIVVILTGLLVILGSE